MKRILSLALCLLLILLLASPCVLARELPEDFDDIPMFDRSYYEEIYQKFGVIPVSIPGGSVHAGNMIEGTSYVIEGDATLILDADRTLDALCCTGNLTIRGDKKLTASIIYAFDGTLTFESGAILCPEMPLPPANDLIFVNGLCGDVGVAICGGSVECPRISGGSETVFIIDGTVKAQTIGALFGYQHSGGSVEAGTVSAREGIYIEGGTLTAGNLVSWTIDFSGGVSTIKKITPSSGDEAYLSIAFPMTITEPAGGRYTGGKFIDAQGSETEQVCIEQVSVDISFNDVPQGAYYYGPVGWALYRNVTKGMTETLFDPNRTCTRAQAVTFLWRAAGCPEPKAEKSAFTDVVPGAFYEKAVRWAVEQGITKGVTETAFAPDKSCTRAEIVTFLWRSEGSPPSQSEGPAFTDVAESAYFASAVDWARRHAITNGTSFDAFSPNRPCTRAQIVTFLCRLYNHEPMR